MSSDRQAPTTLTVVMANDVPTEIALVHENEHRPWVRRTVQIELTAEQRAQLEPRHCGFMNGHDRYEFIERCWFEPGEDQ